MRWLIEKEIQTRSYHSCGALNFFLHSCSYQFGSFLCRPATRVLKKKKLKINVHRPLGTRVVFDDEGHTLPPLARIADTQSGKEMLLDPGMSILFNCKLKLMVKLLLVDVYTCHFFPCFHSFVKIIKNV